MKMQPISTAPKDGTKILVWYDHTADPYQDPENPGHLTAYAAWADGGDFAPDAGYAIAAWQDKFWESTDEYGSGYWMPAAWFLWNDDYEIVVNAIAWAPLSWPPEIAE